MPICRLRTFVARRILDIPQYISPEPRPHHRSCFSFSSFFFSVPIYSPTDCYSCLEHGQYNRKFSFHKDRRHRDPPSKSLIRDAVTSLRLPSCKRLYRTRQQCLKSDEGFDQRSKSRHDLQGPWIHPSITSSRNESQLVIVLPASGSTSSLASCFALFFFFPRSFRSTRGW